MTDELDENRLIAERRSKLVALREQGIAYPNDFHRNSLASQLHQTFASHEDEALREEHIEVAVAGRMMVKRVMGKASFIKLQDRSGQIQIRLERDRLPDDAESRPPDSSTSRFACIISRPAAWREPIAKPI